MTKIGTEVTFDAAHMVQTTYTKCVRIHGHSWKAVIEIEGDVQKNGMVIDFIKIKEIISVFDHKVLLPSDSEDVKITPHKLDGDIEHYQIDVKRKHGQNVMYSFPEEDVCLVKTDVITAENMAKVIKEEIRGELHGLGVKGLKVRVYESPKSWAEV